MAHRVLKTDLSVSGLERIIKELEDYKQSLNDKITLLVEKLADIGIPVIETKIAQAQGDSDKSHSTEINVVSTPESTRATLVLKGEDILFIEFPTGIYYNNGVNHPKAAEFGYGVGTYGKGRGLNPGYWWYKSDDGKAHFSIGTECTMPMYSASLEIIRNIELVVNEVFGNG